MVGDGCIISNPYLIFDSSSRNGLLCAPSISQISLYPFIRSPIFVKIETPFLLAITEPTKGKMQSHAALLFTLKIFRKSLNELIASERAACQYTSDIPNV